MTTTPSRSPLGAFVRSPLGVRGGGGVELYWVDPRYGGIGSAGSNIWQAIGSTGIGNSLPINFSSNGRVWNRDILSLKSVSGEGSKRWSRMPICGGTTGSYCVAAQNGPNVTNSIEVFHSTDLKTWTRTYYYATSDELVCFAWSPLASKFVGITGGDKAITSSDGVNWSVDDVGFPADLVFWNPHTGYFYYPNRLVVFGPVFELFPPRRSTDGITWEDFDISFENHPKIISTDGTTAVGINPCEYIGTDFFGQDIYEFTPSPNIYISIDGLNWTNSHTAASNLTFCCSGGGVLIAGYGSSYPNPTLTVIYYSSDGGSSWNSVTISGFTADWNARTQVRYSCTYAGGKFWLSGLGNGTTLYSSPDGATWTKLQPDEFYQGSDFYVLP